MEGAAATGGGRRNPRRHLGTTPMGSEIVRCNRATYLEGNDIARFGLKIHNSHGKDLVVPKTFVMENLVPIPRHVTVSTVDRKVWDVVMAKSEEGDVQFGEGWIDFLDAYLVHNEYILMFEYDHDSHFYVTIIDEASVEVKRALWVPVGVGYGGSSSETEAAVKGKAVCDESDDRVVFVGMNPRKMCGRCGSFLDGEAKCSGCPGRKRKRCMPSGQCSTSVNGPYLPHFYKVLGAGNVGENSTLELDPDFAVCQLVEGIAIRYLRIRLHNSWVLLCDYRDGRAIISHGWEKFAIDNGLESGDTVMIERSAKDPSTWNVLISN